MKVHLDIVAGLEGNEQRLGRAWLTQKDGKQTMSLEFSALPLPDARVLLVNKENFDLSSFVSAFMLTVKIPKKDKEAKGYFQPLGDVLIHEAGYKVKFNAMPLTGSLVAFGKDN